jgi:hypothetical protein
MSLIIRNPDGSGEGNPRPERGELEGAGHCRRSIMSVIRAKCQDCSAGNLAEVRRCTAVGCALWPYRMGHNPFRAPSTGRPRAENFALKCSDPDDDMASREQPSDAEGA